MKILFLSDLHAAAPTAGVYRNVIAWAGRVLRDQQPDMVVFGGDLLQNNAVEVLNELLAALPRIGQWVWLPGNRDPDVAKFITARGDVGVGVAEHHVIDCDSLRIVALNTEDTNASCDGLANLHDHTGPAIVFAHRLPQRVGDPFTNMLSTVGGKHRWMFAGHQHAAIDEPCAGFRCIGTRGLDPARAKFGRPEVIVVHADKSAIEIERIDMPADAICPTPRRRVTFGIAPAAPVEQVLSHAIEDRIPAVQLTFRTLPDSPSHEHLRLIEQWRAVCPDAFLSIHLSNPDPFSQQPLEQHRSALRWVAEVGVNDLTAHLPKINADAFFHGTRQLQMQAITFYAELTRTLKQAGARLSLENIHNTTAHAKGGIPDLLSTHPDHMRQFIDSVRAELGPNDAPSVGMILDVGHARNNGAVSKTLAPSDWIARLGDLIETLHIHQVVVDGSKMLNHHPITSVHEPLINYEGITACLTSTDGPDCHAFVEVRDLQQAVESWRVMQML